MVLVDVGGNKMLSIEPNVDKQARMDDMALEKLKGSDKQKTTIYYNLVSLITSIKLQFVPLGKKFPKTGKKFKTLFKTWVLTEWSSFMLD